MAEAFKVITAADAVDGVINIPDGAWVEDVLLDELRGQCKEQGLDLATYHPVGYDPKLRRNISVGYGMILGTTTAGEH